MMNKLRNFYKKMVRKIYFFQNHIKVARGSFVAADVNIGRYTRINNTSHIGSCDIGSFCAVGGRLVVRSSDHYTGFANMQEHFQRKVLQSSVKVAGKSKGRVTIGHAVWIGDSVVILSGVSVGNGAVVGAGSIVTKSIPPYAIAVGNPARVLRKRFDDDICALLDEIAWWNWDIAKMQRNKFLFETDLDTLSKPEQLALLNRVVS